MLLVGGNLGKIPAGTPADYAGTGSLSKQASRDGKPPSLPNKKLPEPPKKGKHGDEGVYQGTPGDNHDQGNDEHYYSDYYPESYYYNDQPRKYSKPNKVQPPKKPLPPTKEGANNQKKSEKQDLPEPPQIGNNSFSKDADGYYDVAEADKVKGNKKSAKAARKSVDASKKPEEKPMVIVRPNKPSLETDATNAEGDKTENKKKKRKVYSNPPATLKPPSSRTPAPLNPGKKPQIPPATGQAQKDAEYGSCKFNYYSLILFQFVLPSRTSSSFTLRTKH